MIDAIRNSIAIKIGLAIIGLVVVVLLAFYVSLHQLIDQVLILQRAAHSTIDQIEIWLVEAGIGAVLMAVGLTFFLTNRLIQPLARIESAAREIEKGDYMIKVPVQSADEIGRLGVSINDLAEHLHHLDTSRKEFLADVAHELRTPLTYIKGYSEVVFQKMAQSPEEEHEYLRIIYEQSTHVEHLIDDLFSLAQLDEGAWKIIKEPTDLFELVQRVVANLKPRAVQAQISLMFFGESFGPIMADAARIEQAVANLIDNALRYTCAGGRIDVLLRLTGSDFVEIAVKDTGSGIPEEDLPYIFDRLYRVDKSRSRRQGGTGLGLAIVKQITQAHGGFVSVQSKAGEGTTMIIRLPFY